MSLTEIGSLVRMPSIVSQCVTRYWGEKTLKLVSSAAKVFSDASQSRVSKLLRKAINGGVNCNMSNVKWITFVPGADGYVGVTVVDGIERCWYEGVPQSLETHLSSLKSKTVRSVSVGQGNSWIVVHQDGSSSWDRVPDVLANKLNAGYRSTVEVCPSPDVAFDRS
jgi:hypothetical protein